MDPVARLRAADDFMRRLSAALRAAQLYAPSHPLVQRAFDGLDESITQILDDQPSIAIGFIGHEVIVGDMPLPRAAETLGEMMRRLKSLGIERIVFDRGVTPEELTTLALTIAHPERRPGHDTVSVEASDPLGVLNSLAHIRVGAPLRICRHRALRAETDASGLVADQLAQRPYPRGDRSQRPGGRYHRSPAAEFAP